MSNYFYLIEHTDPFWISSNIKQFKSGKTQPWETTKAKMAERKQQLTFIIFHRYYEIQSRGEESQNRKKIRIIPQSMKTSIFTHTIIFKADFLIQTVLQTLWYDSLTQTFSFIHFLFLMVSADRAKLSLAISQYLNKKFPGKANKQTNLPKLLSFSTILKKA